MTSGSQDDDQRRGTRASRRGRPTQRWSQPAPSAAPALRMMLVVIAAVAVVAGVVMILAD